MMQIIGPFLAVWNGNAAILCEVHAVKGCTVPCLAFAFALAFAFTCIVYPIPIPIHVKRWG